MTLPNPPGGKSFRSLYTTTAAPSNETPFYCSAQRYDETYRLQLPANVPIIAIPQDRQFRNAAGDYRVAWRRDGQQVIVNHQLQVNAIRGKEALCRAQDYPAFRELFQQVRRGFRGRGVRRIGQRKISCCPVALSGGAQASLNSPATSDHRLTRQPRAAKESISRLMPLLSCQPGKSSTINSSIAAMNRASIGAHNLPMAVLSSSCKHRLIGCDMLTG